MMPLLVPCVFRLTCAIQERSQHDVVYEVFAHDAQDLWKASYVYLRFTRARGRLGQAGKHRQTNSL